MLTSVVTGVVLDVATRVVVVVVSACVVVVVRLDDIFVEEVDDTGSELLDVVTVLPPPSMYTVHDASVQQPSEPSRVSQ